MDLRCILLDFLYINAQYLRRSSTALELSKKTLIGITVLASNSCFSFDIPLKSVNKVVAKKASSAPFNDGVPSFQRGSGETDPAKVCEALISMGKRYEENNEFTQAMDCYKAAALINRESAKNAIDSLELKIKNEAELRRQEEEIQALQRGAKQGNAADAYKLGKIYYGRNDIDEAVKMWTLASENKHPKAPYRLALMYEKGDKVSVDFAKSEKFYRIGAANGHAECAYITSKLLEIASSTKPGSEEEAFTLKKEAANRGHPVAAAEVGYAYAAKGEHVKARQYFEKAKKYATPNSTMTVSVRQIMSYNIAAEDVQMLKQ
ncbi:MAG: sel1 repeat family protein [Holosporales bacterium]|jgi:TPR repeat protein|nr:sel1 repeat family protein [Holosporales bacterium]